MMDPLQRSVGAIAAAVVCAVTLTAWSVSDAHTASVKVTAITLRELTGETQVSIATSETARYQLRDVRPEWVVVDILGAKLEMHPGRVPVSGAAVSQVRVGQYDSDVVRVVVEMTARMPADVHSSPDGNALIVGIPAHALLGPKAPVAAAPRDGIGNGIARITAITLWGTPDKPWLSITASGPVRYQLREIARDRVVVDVSKALLTLASGAPPAGRGVVTQVRVGQFAPDVVRVILELSEAAPVHVATSSDRAAIVVSLGSGATTSADAIRPQAHRAASPATTPRPAAGPTPTADVPVAGALPPAGRQSAPPAQAIASAPAPVPSTDRPSVYGYLLGPEDVLEVSVWGYADMTRIVTVRPDGQVAVPLAGTVQASGRTVERLTQDLTRAYAKYIINPQVTVIVKEFRKIRVSVLGQVTHPGTYTLPPGARVMDAVSAASGVTDIAALPLAQLVRASNETRPLNLDSLLVQQDLSQNLILQPGDTLIVPEDTKNKFYVIGDVNHPGIYPLKGDTTVLQALAIAGGPVLHGTASSSAAHIVRRVDPNQTPLSASAKGQVVQPIANGGGVLITMDLQKMYKGDLRQNETLRPGDVMVVPAPGAAALPTLLSIAGLLLGIRP